MTEEPENWMSVVTHWQNRFDLPEAMIPQNLGQRYNIGGLVRQKHAAGLAVPLISQTALRLLGTMGISAAAATKMAQENPTTFNTMLSNLLSGAGELAPSEVFKDKPEEEVERVQEVTQTDWKPSFKPEEPEPPKKPKGPKVGDFAKEIMIEEILKRKNNLRQMDQEGKIDFN